MVGAGEEEQENFFSSISSKRSMLKDKQYQDHQNSQTGNKEPNRIIIVEDSGSFDSPGTQKVSLNNGGMSCGSAKIVKAKEEDYFKKISSTNFECPMPANKQH